MSTLAIIAIVVAVLIVLAIVVSAARKKSREREFAQVQQEARHDDHGFHRCELSPHRTVLGSVVNHRPNRTPADASGDGRTAKPCRTSRGPAGSSSDRAGLGRKQTAGDRRLRRTALTKIRESRTLFAPQMR